VYLEGGARSPRKTMARDFASLLKEARKELFLNLDRYKNILTEVGACAFFGTFALKSAKQKTTWECEEKRAVKK
jgi:hypothetical protein